MRRLFLLFLLVAACSSGIQPEDAPCGLFHDFAVDVQAGIVTNQEARERLVAIEQRSVGSEVNDEARGMLAAYTQTGNSSRFNDAVEEMSSACDAYR